MLKNESNKCACPHCGNHIEFGKDVAGLEIACPHCNDPLSLPENRICEPRYFNAPITQNVILCPNCRESSTTYGKEFAGTQVTCHGCDGKMRIPSFSDAPTDVLEQFEGVFAERKDDAEFDGDSGYHEGEHEIQVNRGWGLVGAVCLVVELITAIGVHFVPDQVMREETRMFVSAVGFIAFVVTIWVVMGIRRVWSARRIALLGSVRFVTPLRKQKLAMGEVLQGQISLALKKPLENCSLGLSLVLLHGTKYSSDNDEDVCLGTSGPIEYRPLCRNTAFRLRNVNLEADSAEVWDFMIPTPQHNPEHVEVPGLFESTLIGGRNSRNYSMAKLLSQEGLRRQRRKHRLVWSQTAELMGPLGVALRRKIQLRVT